MEATTQQIISPATWHAEQARASAVSVAAGAGPLPALAAPATAGADPTFVVARGGKPLLLAPGSGRFEPPRSAQALWPRRPEKTGGTGPSERDLENTPGPICFADRTARLAAARTLESAGMHDAAMRLAYLIRLDIPGPVEVLTAALNRKYVTPDGAEPGSLPGWAKMLGFAGGAGDPDTLRGLWAQAGGTTTAPQTKLWNSLARVTDWLPVTLAGDPGDAYRAAASAADTWAVIRRIDPLGRAAGVVEGTVALLAQPPRLAGGIAETVVSVPFRVRDGEVIAVDADNGTWNVLLDGTVYTDQGLAARFLLSSSGKGGSRRHSGGYNRVAEIDADHPLWVTNSSFLLPPAAKLTGRWGQRRSAPNQPAATGIVPREVPLHVALAGAG